jgi:hypothetical protein
MMLSSDQRNIYTRSLVVLKEIQQKTRTVRSKGARGMYMEAISRWTQSRCRRGYKEDKVMIQHATRIKYFEQQQGEKRNEMKRNEADPG